MGIRGWCSGGRGGGGRGGVEGGTAEGISFELKVTETPAQDGSDVVWRTRVGEFGLECGESIRCGCRGGRGRERVRRVAGSQG